MSDKILLKLNSDNFGYYKTIQDAIKEAESCVRYGFSFGVYNLDDNGKESIYYKDNTALSINPSNIKELIKYYKVQFANDFGVIPDNWDQVLTHRITYYSRPNKSGISVSCPAVFESDFLCAHAARNTRKGFELCKHSKEIVIERYTDHGLIDVKTISL